MLIDSTLTPKEFQKTRLPNCFTNAKGILFWDAPFSHLELACQSTLHSLPSDARKFSNKLQRLSSSITNGEFGLFIGVDDNRLGSLTVESIGYDTYLIRCHEFNECIEAMNEITNTLKNNYQLPWRQVRHFILARSESSEVTEERFKRIREVVGDSVIVEYWPRVESCRYVISVRYRTDLIDYEDFHRRGQALMKSYNSGKFTAESYRYADNQLIFKTNDLSVIKYIKLYYGSTVEVRCKVINAR